MPQKGHQQHRDQRTVDLRRQRVLARADKALDAQVLLQRAEEGLDPPALAIQRRHGLRRQIEMVREEGELALVLVILIAHTPDENLLALGGVPRQVANLVAQHTLGGAGRGCFQDFETHRFFQAGDEQHSIMMQLGQPVERNVAAVNEQQRARRNAELACHGDIGCLAFADHGVGRHVACVIEQQMQLYGSFCALILCPGKAAGAEGDQRGIEARQLVLEGEAMAGQLAAQFVGEAVKQILEHLSRPVLVGVGERGALGCVVQAEMAQFAFRGGKALDDLAQRLGIAELAEQHRDELSPGGEAARMPLGLVFSDQ